MALHVEAVTEYRDRSGRVRATAFNSARVATVAEAIAWTECQWQKARRAARGPVQLRAQYRGGGGCRSTLITLRNWHPPQCCNE